MSLENEDGTQWFKAGWARGADKRLTPGDLADRNYERALRYARLEVQHQADQEEIARLKARIAELECGK